MARTPRIQLHTASIATLVFVLAVAPVPAQTPVPAAQPYADFRGRAIVTISDGDMLASAYVDGRLGPKGPRDALTVTRLNSDLTQLQSASVPVSNSVAGPPTAVAVTRDGRWAFATESFAARTDTAERFPQLAPGALLTVVNLQDLAAPRVTETLDVGKRPEGISVNPAGDLVALTLHPVDGRQLAFVPFINGKLGAPQYVAVPGVDKTVRITHVEWHPSGSFAALTLVDQAQVMFVRVEREGGAIKITPWGNRVLTSKYPFMGRFTPDGRHFLTGNLYWGTDVPGFWTEAVDGDVTSVRFATEATPGADGQPQVRHFLVGKAGTGKDPEGIAISPDGRYVVSVNLETSYAPTSDRRVTMYSSVSLLRLDPATGRLTHLDTHRYDGILPEAATFDASGKFIAIVTYDSFDPSAPEATSGALDFFRITPDEKIVKLRRGHALPRGPHSMQLIQ